MLIKWMCFWTLSIVLFFLLKTAFRRLDTVSVFRLNLLSWAHSVRRERVALLIGPNRAGIYLKTETESSFRKVVF
jgi:hypothetical protein